MVPQRPWLSPWHHPRLAPAAPQPTSRPGVQHHPFNGRTPSPGQPAQSFQLESSDPQSICLGGRKGPPNTQPTTAGSGSATERDVVVAGLHRREDVCRSHPRPLLPPTIYADAPAPSARLSDAAWPRISSSSSFALASPSPFPSQLPCNARLWGPRPGRSGCISEGILRPF